MAEHGAHITSSVGNPSIYEILAQEGLTKSLRLALKYALKILANSQPARFGVLHRYAAEVNLVFSGLLEKYYLSYYGASFAENFYSLKRCPYGKTESSNLNRKAQLKSLFFLVLAPYIREKLQHLYEELREREERGMLARPGVSSLQLKLQRLWLKMYPWLHMCWEGVSACLLFSYVVGHSSSHSPSLWLSGLTLQNLSLDDINAQLQNAQSTLDLGNKSLPQAVFSVSKYAGSAVASGLTSSLSLGVFFLQFLQHWYSAPITSLTTLPIPDSPPQQAKRNEDLSVESLFCPLCNKMRSNDTVLAVSGYVFCYPCIYTYVRDNHRCPVTSYPATPDHLVKIYVQGA